MSFKIRGVSVKISVMLICYLAFAVLLNSSRAVLLSLAFMLFHELAHCAAMAAFGLRARRVVLGVGRFCIEGADAMPNRAAVLVLLAGPAANLALFTVFAALGADTAAKLNFLLAFFNLLPCGELDGGRLFALAARGLMREPLCEHVIAAVNIIVSFGVISVCVVGIWLAESANLAAFAIFCAVSVVCER